MKLKLYALLLASFISAVAVPVQAETVSQRQAKQIATTFFNAAAGQVMAAPKLVYNGRRLTTGSYFAPFYVYNHPAGGYVVISAENKTFPILAYSLKGSFDPEKTGRQERALLTQYARHIEDIRYDSRVPYEAVEAWGDINGHIANILGARYEATDPKEDKERAAGEIDRLSQSDDAEGSMSVIYSPDQWEDMINAELKAKGEVPLGLITRDGEIFPAIIYGRKGDFYRIWLDERDNSLWRLMPSEIESEGQIAVFTNAPSAEEADEAEKPFSFYDSYAPELAHSYAPDAAHLYVPNPEYSYPVDSEEARAIARANAARRALDENRARAERRDAADWQDPVRSGNGSGQVAEKSGIGESLIPEEPVVKWYGSGHYSVTLPEEIVSMRVYGLDGQLVQRDMFRDTNRANVDLTRNPTGFYFAVFFGASGKPYSVKLFR